MKGLRGFTSNCRESYSLALSPHIVAQKRHFLGHATHSLRYPTRAFWGQQVNYYLGLESVPGMPRMPSKARLDRRRSWLKSLKALVGLMSVCGYERVASVIRAGRDGIGRAPHWATKGFGDG